MSGKKKPVSVKEEKADLLRLCHTVPLEVVKLGGFIVCILVPFLSCGQSNFVLF